MAKNGKSCLRRLWKWFDELLFPPKCILCQQLLEDRVEYVCSQCRDTIVSHRPALRLGEQFSNCISPVHYEGVVRESLHRYKFNGKTAYAAGYASIMADCLHWTEQEECDLITWAPISATRLHQRGFDQSELLAKELGRQLGLPVAATLEKTRNNPAQSSLLGATSRWKNVRGVYRVRQDAGVAGKRILLVDDIVTTGATLTECSTMLRKAGAAEIFCATIAATPQ